MALVDNCVAYWKFDEASGNPADATGNGYTLTNNNSVAFNACLINNGADFGASNTNKYFNIASQFGLASADARSFSGWIYVSTEPSSGDVYDFFGQGYNSTDVVYMIEYGNFGGTKRLRIGRARLYVDDPTLLYTVTLTLNTWYHIVYTIDGSLNQVLYVNGTNVASNTATSGNGSGATYDGTQFATAFFGTTRLAKGKVDEWGVWSRVLDASEVTELYNSGAGIQYPFGGGGFVATPLIYMMQMAGGVV